MGFTAKKELIRELFNGFILGLRVNDSSCRMQPAAFRIEVGSLEAGLGLRFIF